MQGRGLEVDGIVGFVGLDKIRFETSVKRFHGDSHKYSKGNIHSPLKFTFPALHIAALALHTKITNKVARGLSLQGVKYYWN